MTEINISNTHLLVIIVLLGFIWFNNISRNLKLSNILSKLSNIEEKTCHRTALYNIRNDLKDIRDSIDKNEKAMVKNE